MNEDTIKTELLDKMSQIQNAMQARLQTWLRERREKIIAEETARRQPGILDRIQSCDSRETAHLMWQEFLDTANAVSQKTINKANRLLETLDFPTSMSQPEPNGFLASSLERFHAALITKFEAETGLCKTPEESNAAFGARVQRTIGWLRFKKLVEETANSTQTFKLPQKLNYQSA